MLNLIKALLQQLDITIVTIIRKINKLQLNIYYIKFSKMCSFSLLNILFSYIAIYLKTIFKIFQISVLFLFIYRLVILLLGYDYILAPHPIELDLLTDFVNNIYSEILHYKNQSLQWIIDTSNSFISNDIDNTSTDSKISIDNTSTESNLSNVTVASLSQESLNIVDSQESLKISDSKNTDLPSDIDSHFYQSPYFYIPAATIAIISISMLGFYYYQEGIFNLWLSFHDLGVNNQCHIYTPDCNLFKPVADSNDVMEYVGNIDYVDNTSSVDLNYLNSPVLPLIDLASPEGSPTPKFLQLQLTEWHQHMDLFHS
jgi:hypothetical protein